MIQYDQKPDFAEGYKLSIMDMTDITSYTLEAEQRSGMRSQPRFIVEQTVKVTGLEKVIALRLNAEKQQRDTILLPIWPIALKAVTNGVNMFTMENGEGVFLRNWIYIKELGVFRQLFSSSWDGFTLPNMPPYIAPGTYTIYPCILAKRDGTEVQDQNETVRVEKQKFREI